MRVAWRTNPLPACFVTVAAEDAETARALGIRRLHGATAMEHPEWCGVERCPELDAQAALQPADAVLAVEEY